MFVAMTTVYSNFNHGDIGFSVNFVCEMVNINNNPELLRNSYNAKKPQITCFKIKKTDS